MTSRALPPVGVALLVFALAGCAGLPVETSSEPAVAASSSSSTSEEKKPAPANEERRTEKREQTVANKTDPEAPRSSWRAERDNQREARAATSGGSDNAKLVEQLNEASRELAALRAANAKLRAERASPAPTTTSSSAPASTAASTRNDATDDKLAASLKSYGQFRQEMANVFADLERLRKENAGMSGNLKAAVEQADQAKQALARAEADLRAEKRSRADAERAVAQLREQLRTIAKALSSAGLSVDKLAASADR